MKPNPFIRLVAVGLVICLTADTVKGAMCNEPWAMGTSTRVARSALPVAPSPFASQALAERVVQMRAPLHKSRITADFNRTALRLLDTEYFKRLELYRPDQTPGHDDPAFFVYARKLTNEGWGFRGLFIDPRLRGLGLSKPLLKLFFKHFPNIQKVHRIYSQPLVRLILTQSFGFHPADASGYMLYLNSGSGRPLLYFRNHDDLYRFRLWASDAVREQYKDLIVGEPPIDAMSAPMDTPLVRSSLQSLTSTWGGPTWYLGIMPVVEEGLRILIASQFDGLWAYACLIVFSSMIHAAGHIFVDFKEGGLRHFMGRIEIRLWLSMRFGAWAALGLSVGLMAGWSVPAAWILAFVFGHAAHLKNNRLWHDNHSATLLMSTKPKPKSKTSKKSPVYTSAYYRLRSAIQYYLDRPKLSRPTKFELVTRAGSNTPTLLKWRKIDHALAAMLKALKAPRPTVNPASDLPKNLFAILKTILGTNAEAYRNAWGSATNSSPETPEQKQRKTTKYDYGQLKSTLNQTETILRHSKLSADLASGVVKPVLDRLITLLNRHEMYLRPSEFTDFTHRIQSALETTRKISEPRGESNGRIKKAA